MLNNIIIFCAFFEFLQLSAAGPNYQKCVTPKNENSLCMELSKCNSLFDMIKKGDLTAKDHHFLRKSQCGYNYEKEEVEVCCPPPQRPDDQNLLPEAPYCGTIITPKIYGGNKTAIDEYPWMALILYTSSNEKGFHCGGTLINNRYVITAAHCVLIVPDNGFVSGVRLGEWNLDTNPDCEIDLRGQKYCAPKFVEVDVEERLLHQRNDIALLRLSESVHFSEFIMPVCLPFDESLRRATFRGDRMDVVGWGKTEVAPISRIKLKATVTVWDFERCKAKYGFRGIALESPYMCAGGEKGIDSCAKDSGGPLVREYNIKKISAFYLIGVVSSGPTPCGLKGWPAKYTRVTHHIDWIVNTIKP